MPRMVAFALALAMADLGELLMGLSLIIMFETYARPSELLLLRGLQVVAPTPGMGGSMGLWSVVIHAQEWEQPGKTNVFDHMVVLDLPRQQWLGPLLGRLAARCGRSGLLWDFGYLEFIKVFRLACRRLDLRRLALCPYMARRGGASHDRAVRARGLRDIQGRGNWRSFRSVQRYEKHGRLGIVVQSLSPAQRRAFQRAEAEAPGRFAAALRRL